MYLRLTSPRLATDADLAALPALEQAADSAFAGRFGRDLWGPPPTGAERAASGIVLAIGQPTPLGFAHLRPIGADHWHLEQLSVHPDAARRGVGTELLHATLGTALAQGARRLTLRTFADVPWNAPWYRRQGFTDLDSPALAPVLDAERRAGLHRLGPRVTLARPLVDDPVPRPAVSVIPLRDGPAGLEVFVQHRVPTMDAFAGVIVFPGGRVDPEDATRTVAVPASLLADHAHRWAATGLVGSDLEASARTLLATGVRELHEETGAIVEASRLVPWDNWVTPIGLPRRFDVAFFLLPDAGDTLGHATTEASASEWMTLHDLVARTEAGELAMVPPTRALVDELQRLGSVEAAVSRRPKILPVRHDVAAPRPRPASG